MAHRNDIPKIVFHDTGREFFAHGLPTPWPFGGGAGIGPQTARRDADDPESIEPRFDQGPIDTEREAVGGGKVEERAGPTEFDERS